MTVTERVPLGAPTLNRKWLLDVNTGTTDVPAWTGVFGITEFKLNLAPTSQDSSDFDSGGYKSSNVTAIEWGAEGKVIRKTTASDATTYDPGQEVLRLAAQQIGLDNTVEVRIYEDNGPNGPMVEAYQGNVGVTWQPDGGGMDANDIVSFALTGQGERNSIEHPGVPVAP